MHYGNFTGEIRIKKKKIENVGFPVTTTTF